MTRDCEAGGDKECRHQKENIFPTCHPVLSQTWQNYYWDRNHFMLFICEGAFIESRNICMKLKYTLGWILGSIK